VRRRIATYLRVCSVGPCNTTGRWRLVTLHASRCFPVLPPQSVQEIANDFDVRPEQYLAKLKEQGVTGIK
jgi:hypothetical protein